MTGAFVAGSPAVGESRSAKPSTEFGIHGAASGFWLPTAPLGFPFHRSNRIQRFSKARRTAKSVAMVSEVLPSASSELSYPEMQEEPLTTHTILPTTTPQALTVHVADGDPPEGIDKSVLAVPEPRRYRNRVHLRFVAQQACLICGRKPSDPHHLGFTQPRALGRKVSDEFTVPLCRGHHRGAHRSRDERAWWRQVGIDPITVARNLWKATLGMGQQPPEPARPDGAAETTNLENEEISAAAERQKKNVQAIIKAKLP